MHTDNLLGNIPYRVPKQGRAITAVADMSLYLPVAQKINFLIFAVRKMAA